MFKTLLLPKYKLKNDSFELWCKIGIMLQFKNPKKVMLQHWNYAANWNYAAMSPKIKVAA